MEHKATRVYFPGLNALRFFAATAVMVTHFELIKYYLRKVHGYDTLWFDIWGKWLSGPDIDKPVISCTPIQTIISDPNIQWYHPVFAEAGPLGVIFFFVLSGFLITYLLFTEQDQFKTISVRKFYIRRFLRIWPLYYLVVFIGFFILPQSDLFHIPVVSDWNYAPEVFWGNFFLFMIVFPNLAMAVFGPFPNIGQLWSIGVEEQFYLIWPWFIRTMKKHLRAIVWFIVGFVAFKALVLFIGYRFQPNNWQVLTSFLAMTKLESMAIGGLGSWVLFHKKDQLLKWVYHPFVQVGTLISVVMLIYVTPTFLQDGIHVVYSVLFLVVILNVSSNTRSILKLEHPVLHSLGRISYGMYMYHMMVILGVMNLAGMHLSASWRNSFIGNTVLFGVSFALSILISYLSYHWLEKRFIRLKSPYTKVTSGDDARKA